MMNVKLLAAVIALAALGPVMPALADTPKSVPAADAAAQPSNLMEVLFGVGAKGAAEAAKATPAGAARPKASAARAVGRRTADSPGAAVAPRSALKARIAAQARAAGVPVALAEAVVAHESRFNPLVRGSHGEVGLMQIKPQTARGLGYRGTTAQLFDVDTNLKWGMAYLATAYKLADGDTCGTILRYNAGHRAKRMTRQASSYCASVQTYVASL